MKQIKQTIGIVLNIFAAVILVIPPQCVLAQTLSAQSTSEREVVIEVFDDFEQGYGKWEINGKAFGTAPASGTLQGQQNVSGYHGNRCVNTFLNGDGTTGKATSKSFVIQKPYISFLIGGGSDSELTAFRLLVDGKVVQTALGSDDERLRPYSWDVSRWTGHSAQLQIIDAAIGAWGHILVDNITFSAAPPHITDETLIHKYLVVPVYFDDTSGISPHPITYYQTLVGSRWPGLDYYFKIASGGRVSLAGTTVWNWTKLPGNAVDYAGESVNGKRGWDFRKLLDGRQITYGEKARLTDWYGVFFCLNVLDDNGGGAATWIEEEIGGKKVLYPVSVLNPTQGHCV